VGELVNVPGSPGLRLQRVPEAVRAKMDEKSGRRMLAPDGAEIRFVSEGESVEIVLSAPTTDCELLAFWGGFQDVEKHQIGRDARTIKLTYPQRLARMRPAISGPSGFPPSVWRLTLRGVDKLGTVHFHEIRGRGLRPPTQQELPSKTYLAYGTSVTDGFGASAMHLTFIAQAARALAADYVNLGCAGSAFCEAALADYIAARRDWHFATICISINMVGAGYTAEQFRERAKFFVNTIAAADGNRPIFCITPLPYFADLCPEPEGPHNGSIAADYRQALRDVVSHSAHRNLHLIEGADLLTDVSGYTIDLAHPGDFGMMQIAQNLVRRMRPVLEAKT
jgi:hypothetical protein